MIAVLFTVTIKMKIQKYTPKNGERNTPNEKERAFVPVAELNLQKKIKIKPVLIVWKSNIITVN
jgi:hypothetical protein